MCFQTRKYQVPQSPAAAPAPPIPTAQRVKKAKPSAAKNRGAFSLRLPRGVGSGLKS